MVTCPKCGKPLVKGARSKSRYYCKTEDCPVIFVRYTKDSVYIITDENGLEKLEEVTVKKRVILSEREN